MVDVNRVWEWITGAAAMGNINLWITAFSRLASWENCNKYAQVDGLVIFRFISVITLKNTLSFSATAIHKRDE